MAQRIYVTQPIPEAGISKLTAATGVDVEVNPDDRVLTHEELVKAVRGRAGVLCLLTDRIDADVLQAADGCKVFANYAVGHDNIDVAEATRLKMLVTNTPGVLTEATADLAWALLFSAARRIVEADRFVREGRFVGWGPTLLLGADITGRTLGIIGAGRIGTAMALRSVGFGMNVIYTDLERNATLEEKTNARKVELDELLSEADFISTHVSLNEKTRHLIGSEQFARMKPTVVLVNSSRGAIFDEQALLEFLQRNPSAAAGLDVYENEPELTSGLSLLDNVVLLPHIGSATVGTRSRMAVMAAENLLKAINEETPPNLVNPEALEGDS